MRNKLAITLLLACHPWSFGGLATDCNLAQAMDYYRVGRLQEAIEQASDCLLKGVSRKVGIRAQALVGMAHAAAYHSEQAAEAIAALVTLVPDYEPELLAPSHFVELLNEEKRTRALAGLSTAGKGSESL